MVEHNVEFMAHVSDWIIDFGLHGGEEGGQITYQGRPNDVFSCAKSSLYGLLR